MSIILRNLELFCNHSQKVDIVKTCQNNTLSLVDVISLLQYHIPSPLIRRLHMTARFLSLFLPFNMDIKTLLDNLHEEVSCSVCMCKFTDPKQLPCLHSFCLHCLNGIQRTSANPNVIACPECRQEFRVPENGNLQTKRANTAFIVSSVVHSGVTTVSLCIMASEPIKSTMRWR